MVQTLNIVEFYGVVNFDGTTKKNLLKNVQNCTFLDTRGYCARTSIYSYSLGVANYRITYPSKYYPSTAPYNSLSHHFRSLVKCGLVHRFVIKALLYPELLKRASHQLVRLRRNQYRSATLRRRQSICSSSELSMNDSNDACDSSATSSINFVHGFPCQRPSKSTNSHTTSIEGIAIDCTKEIFAEADGRIFETMPVLRSSDGSLMFTHESNDCDIKNRDSLQYYSKPVKVVLERRPTKVDSFIHTTTAQMTIGGTKTNRTDDDNRTMSKGSPSDMSILSGYQQRTIRGNMGIEDLVNMDESIEINNIKPTTIDERHSMPPLFVGNRFNCSSMTEVFIPSYRKDSIDHDNKSANELFSDDNDRNSNQRISTISTHSSSVDIPPIVPAPDQLSIELLYNPSGASTRSNSEQHLVIKPPSMFDAYKTSSREPSPPISRSSSSHRSTKSPQLKLTNIPSEKKKCGMCSQSPCISQRSSDSGMAGSCTISSPDAPIINPEVDFNNIDDGLLPRLNGLMHSRTIHNFEQFTESIPFIDSNHDSGQYGESESEQQRDSANADNATFDLSSSQNTVHRKSRCHSVEPESTTTNMTAQSNDDEKGVFKTGLYAHWWKKEPIPKQMLSDIYRMKMNSASRQASSSRGSGKHRYSIVVFVVRCVRVCVRMRLCFKTNIQFTSLMVLTVSS